MHTSRKGQYSVVEQVILFGLGIAIAGGFLGAFENFGDDVTEQGIQDQADHLSELIGSHTIHLIETRADSGTLEFELPNKIANQESYTINLTKGGVAVIVGSKSYLNAINGIEQKYQLQGSVTNDFETATITLQDNTITLAGS